MAAKGGHFLSLCKSPSMEHVGSRDRVTNGELYGDLPILSERMGFSRLGLASHCQHHRKLPASQFVLWWPTHRHLRRFGPLSTFIDTLMRDAGAAFTSELSARMDNKADWAARWLARLRPPEWMNPCLNRLKTCLTLVETNFLYLQLPCSFDAWAHQLFATLKLV